MEATMQISTKSLSVLVLVLLAAACGSARDPDSMPAANGGGGIEGTVDAIDGAVLTVAGRKVAVTDATKIRKDDVAATLADLTVGTPVEVEGTLNADGTVTASEIRVEDRNDVDRVAFVGTLTQITGNTLTVGALTVNVSSTTATVKGDTALTLPDLMAGDRLLLRGTARA